MEGATNNHVDAIKAYLGFMRCPAFTFYLDEGYDRMG